MPEVIIKGGARNIDAKDVRTFSRAAYFGSMHADFLPDFDFDVCVPLAIKDQGDTDFCTAAGLMAVSEPHEGVELSMEYQMALTKELEGNPATWGADPLDALKVVVNVGSLEASNAPFTLAQNGRDYCADIRNWPAHLRELAAKHKKKAFFKVDGNSELFDSIRSALWLNRAHNRAVFVGVYWQPDWTNVAGGVIPSMAMASKETGVPHAFAIIGQKNINGRLYLKAQLSNGTAIGDGGLFYLPRDVANQLAFAYTVEDADPEDVKRQTWGWRARLKNFIVELTKRFHP